MEQYYIPTRYPDGLPVGAPYEVYTKTQAVDAVRAAQTLLDFARRCL